MHKTALCVLQVPTNDLHEAFPESLRLFAASSGFKVIAWAGTHITEFFVSALVCYGNAAFICHDTAMSLLELSATYILHTNHHPKSVINCNAVM